MIRVGFILDANPGVGVEATGSSMLRALAAARTTSLIVVSVFCWLAASFLASSLWATAARSADPDESFYVSQVSAATTGDLAPGAQIVVPGRPLSIQEAVALSIRNNLDVEVERFAPMISEAENQGAWGVYDPLLSADMVWDVAKSPNSFGLDDATTSRDRELGGGVGVEQLIPYVGATVSARYESSSKMTRSTVQAFSPQYDSSFFLEAKVPLARGLIWNQEWTNVKVAGLAYSSSLEGFRASLMDLVQTTVDAYWSLIASRDQVFVAQKSLETARALLEQTKTQYEVGVISRVEVVEAEAGVADRELQVIRSANVYRNAQDQIVNFVLGTELSAISDLHFSPTDDPAAFEPRTVNISRAVDRAFRNRPELQQVGLEIDQGEVNVKFAKNQRLPQLDAEFRYGFVGKAGDPNISQTLGDPPNTSSFADAHNDFFKSDGADNFRVMGRFSIPFPNTTARKRVIRNELELRRARTRETRLEQSIILEIRIAARTLLASFQGIEASERRRLAATEQLRAERIRLEHGESTPFEVLQRESDLVEAESQKISALQTYRSSEVALERSQGTILDFHNIVLDDAAELTY